MEFLKENNRIYSKNTKGEVVAEITFQEIKQGIFNIDHTFVDDSLRGQGIAGELVKMAIEEIKKRGGEVRATCSYARHYIEKNGI